MCWTSQARPHAAALFKKVLPSTEKGRGELESSVTGGGGPPNSPAETQTLLLSVTLEELAEVFVDVAAVVERVELSLPFAAAGAPEVDVSESFLPASLAGGDFDPDFLESFLPPFFLE